MKKSTVNLILCAVILVLSVVWMRLQWVECRSEGLSISYCIQHVG